MSFIPFVTNPKQGREVFRWCLKRHVADKVLFRLHGRNVQGWRNTTGDDQAWRKVRYLYNYNEEELEEIQNAVKKLETETDEVFVVFNNNSGGHAAQNAKQFQKNARHQV